MSLIEIQNLSHHYGGRQALDIESLEIEGGRITALLGPNGSGKTTLLMLIGQLLPVQQGNLLVRGKDMAKAPAAVREELRRGTGFLLQTPYLFKASVERNVAYGLRVRGQDRKLIPARTEEALNEVGLEGFGDRPHWALSGGEAQRVALARALVTNPRTLFLDEPMANVDTVSRAVIERVLVDRNRSDGLTVVMTTHDMDQAYRLADHAVTLQGGRIALSSMENVFHGRIYRSAESWVFDTGRLALAIPSGHQQARTAAVPPEVILVSRDLSQTSALNTLKGKVTGIRERNGSVDVAVEVGETMTARVTDESYRRMGLGLGEEVYLIFKAEAVRLY
jgi:tungstate transport system ATP-binding protein